MNEISKTSHLARRTLPTEYALAGLALLIVVAYWNSMGNEFVFDDRAIVLGNRLITDLENLPVLLISGYWDGTDDLQALDRHFDALYRPLVIASYSLNYAVGNVQSVGYRMVNVGLHVVVTWLVFMIALQLGIGVSGSLVSAALFAVHPLHVEAVSYIVGRAELMMATGVLASLWWTRRGKRALAVGAFAAGLLSKEQAILFPLLLILYEFCLGVTPHLSVSPRGGEDKGGGVLRWFLARYGVYALVLVGYFVLRLYVLRGNLLQTPGFLENPAASAGWPSQVLTAIKVAGMYLWLFVWPASLSADYSYDAIPLAQSLLEPSVMGGLMAWLGLIGLAGWAWMLGARAVVFCVGMILLSYFPVSNVVFPIGTIMGERLFYLPSVGLCLLVGLAYERLAVRNGVLRTTYDAPRTWHLARRIPLASYLAPRTFVTVLVGLVCLALTARTVARNRDWRDNETLFEQTATVVPRDAKAHALLGHALALKSSPPRRDRAIEAYRTALSIYPDYFRHDSAAVGNLSRLLAKAGRSTEAHQLLLRTIAADPEWGVMHYFLALHYTGMRQPELAEDEWRKAIALSPQVTLFQSVYSRFLIERGRYSEGLAVADQVLQHHPEVVLAVFNRGLALQALSRFDEAAEAYERVLTMPDAPDAAKQDAREKLDYVRGCLVAFAGCNKLGKVKK